MHPIVISLLLGFVLPMVALLGFICVVKELARIKDQLQAEEEARELADEEDLGGK